MFVGIVIFGLLVATSCAQTDDFVEIAPYIVNGTDALIEEFPFMVRICVDYSFNLCNEQFPILSLGVD